MANGSFNLTSSKAWRGKVTWESTSNIAGNYSDVSIYATMWKTDGYTTSSNTPTYGTITVNGKDYDLTKYQQFKDEVCIFEDTIRVYHDDDGFKSIEISVICHGQADTSLSGYTLEGSGTAVLDTIPRTSSFTATNGKLGNEQTFSITKADDDFTHTIAYQCGSASGTICDKTSETSVAWTPPLSLASQSTTGTNVAIVLTLTTYSGGTPVGTVTKTIYCDIPSSGLTASNGTLGTLQYLTISRAASNLKHTITYECGNVSGTICDKTSLVDVPWTPPLSLASQNTTGLNVSITLTMTTYNGGSTIGSVTKTIYCTIPPSVAPSGSLTVTDAMGYESIYGAMLQGLSKFKITVNVSEAYGAEITAYAVTANGSKYDTASVTTETLQASGQLAISATVTDTRNRSGSASTSKTVLPYIAPGISKLDVSRCNEDGSANDHGEFAKVLFAYTVTSLNGKNGVSCVLRYKKAVESVFTTVSFPELSNAYSVTGYSYIFPADSASSYDVELAVSDNFHTAEKDTKASTGFTLMHWKADGTGMAIGKLSEKSYALEIALPVFDEDGNQFIGCEEGTSGIWKYRKWTNGACELWGTVSVSSQACTTAFGGMYRSEQISLDEFPFTVTDPVVVASFDPGGILWAVSAATIDKPPSYYLIYPISTTGISGKINLHVVGKW